MNEITIPSWAVRMLQDVLDMRDAQQDFFSQPSEYKKRVAIAKEQKVDQWTSRALKSGVIQHKPKTAPQKPPSLF